jgi:hypothetical protein
MARPMSIRRTIPVSPNGIATMVQRAFFCGCLALSVFGICCNGKADPPIPPVESPKPTTDQKEVSEPDSSKTDSSKTDSSKTDGSKTDGSKTDGSKTDGSKTDGSKTGDAKPGLSTPDSPNPASTKPDVVREQTSLNKSGTVQIDLKGKRLLVQSEVVLREGLLEMLACLKQTKEHESILGVDAKAQLIHAGLVALGAEVGHPAKFVPEYQPASGQRIDIFLTWTDAAGKLHRDPAQSWIRNATRRYFIEKLDALPKNLVLAKDNDLKWDEKHKELLWYGPMSASQRDELSKLSDDAPFRAAIKSIYEHSQIRQMEAQWVFSGSGFNTDETTGEKFYLAEAGDLICVANFATATVDLSIESSATNDGLMFEAFTERIPPMGTKVTIELVPVFKKTAATNDGSPAGTGAGR